MATFTGTHEVPTEAPDAPGDQRSGADSTQAAAAIADGGGRGNNAGIAAAIAAEKEKVAALGSVKQQLDAAQLGWQQEQQRRDEDAAKLQAKLEKEKQERAAAQHLHDRAPVSKG